MNTLGVRGMALTETLLKYNEAAEDASKIKGIGLDPEQMSDINRQLQLTQAQMDQLTMAGGALLAPLGVDAEDAGGVGSLEAQGVEGAVVGLVDADMQLFAFGTDKHRAAFSHHVFQQLVAVGVEVVVAEVEGDVKGADGGVGIETHFDLVGVCCQGHGEEQEYGKDAFQGLSIKC